EVRSRGATLRVFDQKFDVDHFRFSWRGGPTRNPPLDILITRQYPEAFATVPIGGTYGPPALPISSGPPPHHIAPLKLLISGRSGQSPNAPLALPSQPDA